MSLDTTGGVFTYKVATPEGLRTFSPAEIVDVVMLADDGLNGRSPIHLAREAMGLPWRRKRWPPTTSPTRLSHLGCWSTQGGCPPRRRSG